MRAGNIRIDISDPIIDETMRVLRDKFQWPGELTHHTRGELATWRESLDFSFGATLESMAKVAERRAECSHPVKGIRGSAARQKP